MDEQIITQWRDMMAQILTAQASIGCKEVYWKMEPLQAAYIGKALQMDDTNIYPKKNTDFGVTFFLNVE